MLWSILRIWTFTEYTTKPTHSFGPSELFVNRFFIIIPKPCAENILWNSIEHRYKSLQLRNRALRSNKFKRIAASALRALSE